MQIIDITADEKGLLWLALAEQVASKFTSSIM